MNFLDRRTRRPITDAVRQTVLDDLPELANVQNEELQRKIVEAWAYALCESSFGRITDIPGEANPGMFRLKSGTQATHLRGVARVALGIAEDFIRTFPDAVIDRDIVLAGGLVHDVGKAWELDPENVARWKKDGSQTGLPALRHPVYGAHVCIAVGLPEEIAHIALAHSFEGDLLNRSLECIIVQRADHLWWAVAGGAGLLVPDTATALEGRKIIPRELRGAD